VPTGHQLAGCALAARRHAPPPLSSFCLRRVTYAWTACAPPTRPPAPSATQAPTRTRRRPGHAARAHNSHRMALPPPRCQGTMRRVSRHTPGSCCFAVNSCRGQINLRHGPQVCFCPDSLLVSSNHGLGAFGRAAPARSALPGRAAGLLGRWPPRTGLWRPDPHPGRRAAPNCSNNLLWTSKRRQATHAPLSRHQRRQGRCSRTPGQPARERGGPPGARLRGGAPWWLHACRWKRAVGVGAPQSCLYGDMRKRRGDAPRPGLAVFAAS